MSTVGLPAQWPLRAPSVRRGAGWLVALLVIDLLWAMLSIGTSLHTTQGQLQRFARASASGDAGTLEAALREAATAARSARGALDRHPSLALLRATGFGSDLAAASTLAEVAERSASIGADLLTALETLSEDGALISDGRLIERGLDELRLDVGAARADLDELLADVGHVDASHFGWLDARVRKVHEHVMAATQLGDRVDKLLSLLPGLAGYAGERRYLLALQSPSEARGGGGLIGLYGVLHVESGRFRLGHVGPPRELNEALRKRVAAPAWFDDLYGSLGATQDMRLANLSPSFPTVARVLLNMYAAGTGKSLDGVIAMDPIAFGKLTKATGPVEAPGWDVRVNSASARRVLLKDIYLHFGRWRSKAQNAYLERLVRKLWTELLSGNVAAAGLGAAWADAAATQHFKIYSEERGEQRGLADLGIAGDLRSFGPQLQMVFHNNWSGSKIDHYFRRRLTTEIGLLTSGAADITTTVSMRNRSPGDASLLSSGRGVNDLPAGLNRMTLSFVLPRGAQDAEVLIDGQSVELGRGRESGYPLVWLPVDVLARSETELTVHYSIADFFRPGSVSEMTFTPQVMERPDLMEVTVAPPPGYEIVGLDRGAAAEDHAWRATRLMKGPVTLRWNVTPE